MTRNEYQAGAHSDPVTPANREMSTKPKPTQIPGNKVSNSRSRRAAELSTTARSNDPEPQAEKSPRQEAETQIHPQSLEIMRIGHNDRLIIIQVESVHVIIMELFRVP